MAPSGRALASRQSKQSTSTAAATVPTLRRGITTRSRNNLSAANAVNPNPLTKPPTLIKDARAKRKADASPVKEKTSKRSALGNITNAFGKTLAGEKAAAKKAAATQAAKPFSQVTALKPLDKVVNKQEHAVAAKATATKPLTTRAKSAKKEEEKKVEVPSKIVNLRRSVDLEKSEDNSLYVSALEDISEETTSRRSTSSATRLLNEGNKSKEEVIKEEEEEEEKTSKSDEEKSRVSPPVEVVEDVLTLAKRLDAVPENHVPAQVDDFDGENWEDPYQVSHYAMSIFNYLKQREQLFPIGDYMDSQVCLSRWMRSLLVDWMVEVQESFELNHETLYLAVKLVDLYLTKVTVGRETLQLLGAASLFIASKYDERIPPMLDDFLYICDGAYSKRELLRMEMSVLKMVDFDLGIPLSYRFLRRYARCAKVTMPTLTLARYILEYSLMDYSTITFSDSKMAAAALLLAMQMKDLGGWTRTLEYYTGFKVDDFREIVRVLNEGLHRKHKEALATVRNKYSHKIFFEVAKVPLKDTLDI